MELYKALSSMPTLEQGQADDLKIRAGNYKVWVSRLVEGHISVEKLVDGAWIEQDGE